MPIVRRDPARRWRLAGQRLSGMDRDGDGLGRDRGIGLLRAIGVLVSPELVVIELVRQLQRVEVAPRVEGPDRIRVVCPAFVTRDMTLDRPRRTPVERLVEP